MLALSATLMEVPLGLLWFQGPTMGRLCRWAMEGVPLHQATRSLGLMVGKGTQRQSSCLVLTLASVPPSRRVLPLAPSLRPRRHQLVLQ
jgi:hypothetical protein